MKRVYLLIALALILAMVSAKPVQAGAEYSLSSPISQITSVESSNVDNLTKAADIVLEGVVTGIRSYWNAGGTLIFTDITVSVERVVKGDASLQQVTVVVEGGQVGGLRLSLSGSPEFQVNQRGVFFLKQAAGGVYTLASWQIGVDVVLSPQASFGISSLVVPPVISSIIPSSGSAGANTQVIINGSNFGATQGSGKVTFYYKAGQPRIEAAVVFWYDTSIVVAVPTGTINSYDASASSGQVMVSTSAGDSNPYPYAVTFSYGGQKWSVTSPVVHYRVNPNAPGVVGVETAVQAAAQTWSSVPDVDFQFVYDGVTGSLSPAFNGLNEIMWGDLGSSGPLATTFYWSDNSYNILEFDIKYNSNKLWSTSGSSGHYDVQTVATHELGHALGFRDLYGDIGIPNDIAKIMYGRAAAGEIRRNLTADDLTGIRWIYPVMPTIQLGDQPGDGGFGPAALGVNPITNRIYVGNSLSNNVSVIDGNTNQIMATVNVGKGPQGIAVNPVTNRIYLANSFSNSVSVINGASNSLVATVSVGSLPFRLGVNASNNRIYVANYGSNSVSVIDGTTNSVIQTVNVGSRPAGVGVNSTTNMVFVSNDGSNNVSVIDGSSNTVVNTISVGNEPGGLDINPIKNYVYVANYGSNSLSVIDGATNSLVTTLNVGESPRGVTVNPTSNRIYVANSGANSISVIDGATKRVTGTVEVGSEPFGVGLNDASNLIYAANYSSNSISIIDGATNVVVLTVKTASGPDAVGVNSITNCVYVASGDSRIAVIDGSTNSIATTVNVGSSPAGIGVNSTTNRIYVANSGSNTVSVIDGVSNSVIAAVDVGNRPSGVGVNPVTNRIYVANNGSYSLSVIDGVSNSVVTTIEVGFLPIGVGVNPSTNRIYVANNYSNTVSVIEGASNSVVDTVDVGAWPFGLVVNPLTNRIYAANNGSNNISVIDGATNSVVATARVGISPRGLVLNPLTNRIYAANNGNNSISVLDGSTNIVLATQNVGKGPRSIGVDPGTNRLWVINYWADNLSMLTDSFGTAAKLSFIIQPSAASAAGVNFAAQPVVVAQDSGGYVVTNSNAPVTLSITSGAGASGAVLSGTAAVDAVNGTAAFDGLSINLAGTGYTLTATSGTLTSAVSISFAVVHIGDANGDGLVNMGDVTKVERVILGLDPQTCGCDANNDKSVNMGDVTQIERFILGLDILP